MRTLTAAALALVLCLPIAGCVAEDDRGPMPEEGELLHRAFSWDVDPTASAPGTYVTLQARDIFASRPKNLTGAIVEATYIGPSSLPAGARPTLQLVAGGDVVARFANMADGDKLRAEVTPLQWKTHELTLFYVANATETPSLAPNARFGVHALAFRGQEPDWSLSPRDGAP